MLNIAIYRCCEASLTSVWHFQHVQISTATNIPEVKGVLAYSVYHLKAPSVASCHSSGTFAHCIEAISQTTQSFCSTKPSINQKQFSLSPALRAPKITSQPTWFQAVDWKSRRVVSTSFLCFGFHSSSFPTPSKILPLKLLLSSSSPKQRRMISHTKPNLYSLKPASKSGSCFGPWLPVTSQSLSVQGPSWQVGYCNLYILIIIPSAKNLSGRKNISEPFCHSLMRGNS